jgi:hypothetical protein
MGESPRFVGAWSPAEERVRLGGYLRPPSGTGFRDGFFAVGAVAFTLSAVGVWVSSTLDGETELGGVLLLLAVTAFSTFLAIATRALGARAFPLAANRLSRALASALECTAPTLPEVPLAARTIKRFVAVVVAVTVLAQVVRFALVASPVTGVVLFLAYSSVLVLGFRIAMWWQPRLHGSVLQVGLRRVNLDAVHDVRARPAVMSLSDGRSRVTISSSFGRPARAREARELLEAPMPGRSSRARQEAEVVVAVDGVLERCALDPPTAAALHRTPALPDAVGRAPYVDPVAAAPAIAVLVGVACALVLSSLLR